MTEAESIVQELAEDGPYESESAACQFCNELSGLDLNDVAIHRTNCLWRRAKELFP